MPGDLQTSVLRPHGTVIITDLNGATTQQDTLRCCHCQGIWIVVRGSGRRRGFCTKCMGPTCGSEGCHHCVPFEKKLEMIEKSARG